MNKIVIMNVYREKNKQSFFAIHQFVKQFKSEDNEIEFHIVWDNQNRNSEWAERFSTIDCKIVEYDKQFIEKYCLDGGVSKSTIHNFGKFKYIYHIVLGHYLRTVMGLDYAIRYDDDILIRDNCYELRHSIRQLIPFVIAEPFNINCDKILYSELYDILGEEFRQRIEGTVITQLGFNSGLMGISLSIYDHFNSSDGLNKMLSLFVFGEVEGETDRQII